MPNRYTPNPQYSACATPDTVLVPQLPREKLCFLQEIGEGCFGKVYKGKDIMLVRKLHIELRTIVQSILRDSEASHQTITTVDFDVCLNISEYTLNYLSHHFFPSSLMLWLLVDHIHYRLVHKVINAHFCFVLIRFDMYCSGSGNHKLYHTELRR